MESSDTVAIDGKHYEFQNKGNTYLQSWHPAEPEAHGEPFGSAAICFVEADRVVIGTAGGEHSWEVPGGRPEPGESWEDTLYREVMEEACAQIDEACLLGFARTECLTGSDRGRAVIRSLWVARVTLLPWKPEEEIKIRQVVPFSDLLTHLDFPYGQMPIWCRWMREATKQLQRRLLP